MNVAESQVESLFFAALEIQAPAERAAFLDGACRGNPELRQRVEQLLQVHPQVENFLHIEPPPASGLVGTVEQSVLERPGTVIGPYKLLEQIGEGGFGIVFMAEQTQPVRRKVALKVLKPGMDTRQVIARFEAERQALAVMDHPNIAKVLEAGETSSGRPYFVMELVKGIPITEFCDQVRMPTRKRLQLLIDVCRAVQHAHQKGIIHRDLKPSNVLVTMADGAPIVKVIDFGIAKAAGQQLTEKTLFTGFGQMIGTPLYMSPEQAALSAVDVDTRSDVYSLGVLLYELLTGSTPFDKETLAKAGYDEMRRIIREDEPPRPSARLSELGKSGELSRISGALGRARRVGPASSLASISALRQTEPAKLSHLMRGELDWIVMKTLEKDRNRRYETANALADDVHRYLADEPVQACPPSVRYRFQKFARKNKGVLATLMAVAAALLIGTAISLWQASEAIAARKLADQRLVETEIERQRAAANYERAHAAVDQMLTRVAIEKVGSVPEMKEVRQSLLEDAVQFYTELLKLNPRDPQAFYQRGRVFLKLARDTEAITDFQKTLDLEPKNGLALEEAAKLVLWGTYPGNDANAATRIRYVERAIEAAPEASVLHYYLATFLLDLGRVQEARTERNEFSKRMPDTPAAYYRLSTLTLKLGEKHAALEYAERGISLDATLGGCYTALGNALSALGDIDAAGEALEKGIRFNKKPNDIDSWRLYESRGDHYTVIGNYEAALRDYDNVIMLRPNPSWHLYKRRAKAHFFLGHYAEALADMRTSLEINPNDLSALTLIPQAGIDACPSEEFRNGVFQLIRQTIERKPESAEAYNGLAWLLATYPDPNVRDVTRAVELAKKAVELTPQEGVHWRTLGIAHYRAGDWQAARSALDKSIDLGFQRGSNLFFLALAHWQLDHKAEARKWYDQAVEWMEKNQPQNEELRRFRAEAEELLGVKEGPK